VQNLEAVAADLRRQAYRPGVTGSNTAANLFGAKRAGLVHQHGPTAVGTTALAWIGEKLGEHVAGHGLIGMGVSVAAGALFHMLRQRGINTMNDLLREAMLHPSVARELLRKVNPNGTIGKTAMSRIVTALQVAVAADSARGEEQQRQ
jgi:hypothetical protein